MKKSLVCLLVLVLLLAVGAATAVAASLPKPANSTVVIPTSVAGITINMPEAKARSAWGGRGKCSNTPNFSGCEYGSRESSSGSAIINFQNGKVGSVYVYGAQADGVQKTTAAAPLLKIKTSSGVGIGATFAALKKAAPKGEVEGDSSGAYFKYYVAGKAGQRMTFELVNGKVGSFGLAGEGA